MKIIDKIIDRISFTTLVLFSFAVMFLCIISFEINGLNYLDGSSTTSKIEDDGSLLISSNTGYDLDDAIMDNVIEKYKGNRTGWFYIGG